MATWHQLRNKTKLYHDTKWTVLIDPPNDMRCSYLFNTEQEAEAFAKGRAHALVLRPACVPGR